MEKLDGSLINISMAPVEKITSGPIPAWQIPNSRMPVPKPENHTPQLGALDSAQGSQLALAVLDSGTALQPTKPLAKASAKARVPFSADEEPELRDPTRFGIAMSLVNVFLYSLMALAQWIGWGGFYAATGTQGRLVSDAIAVMIINFLFGLLVIAGVFALKPTHFRARVRYPIIALVALAAAAPRVLAMMSIYTTPTGPTFMLAELISGWVAGTVAVGAGVMTAGLVGRARREHARWMVEHEKARRSSDELHTEEMRVRRMVADQLHGRLQFRLVSIAAGLDADAARYSNTGDEPMAQMLREYADQLDHVREQEVRALSHAVYPAGIELGAVSAIRAMVHRLPTQIKATVATCPTLTAVLDNGLSVIPLTERLIAVFTIEEALTNAIKHGDATNLAIELELSKGSEPGQVVLVGRVDDNGKGLGQSSDIEQSHTGLSRHTERLTNRGGNLTLAERPDGGVRLEFSLPFTPLVPVAELEALTNWSKGLKLCSA